MRSLAPSMMRTWTSTLSPTVMTGRSVLSWLFWTAAMMSWLMARGPRVSGVGLATGRTVSQVYPGLGRAAANDVVGTQVSTGPCRGVVGEPPCPSPGRTTFIKPVHSDTKPPLKGEGRGAAAATTRVSSNAGAYFTRPAGPVRSDVSRRTRNWRVDAEGVGKAVLASGFEAQRAVVRRVAEDEHGPGAMRSSHTAQALADQGPADAAALPGRVDRRGVPGPPARGAGRRRPRR